MKKTNAKTALMSLAAVASLGTLALANGSASAWGPERPTFTMEVPATYPVFNSITDAPTFGDERDFVRVGQINADVTELTNEVEIIPGRQYLVYIYFHNNAASNFNSAEQGRKGIAKVTRMSSSFTKIVTPEEKGTITGTITADNSDPLSVWDEAYFTTKSKKVVLKYVEGSAKMHNSWGTNGQVMPTNLFTEEGTLLGLNAFNGVIPGCEEYHGVVTYVLQADELSGSIEKSVSKDGKTFTNALTDVEKGDELTFKLTVKNTGDLALGHAVIKDSLPQGLAIVPGSVEYWANNSTVKDHLSDNLVNGGYVFGTIGTGNTLYFTYRATVKDNIDCNGVTLTNTATLIYDSEQTSGDSSTATATVTTDNTCKPDEPETPVTPDEPTTPTDPEPLPDPEPTPEPEPGTPDEIVNTGPLEITLAVIIVLGILAGGFYFWRTRHALKSVEKEVKGDIKSESKDEPKNEE